MKETQGRFRVLYVLNILLLTWLSTGATYGQSSANFQIQQSVLDAGGGARNSDSFSLCDSLGQVSGAGVSSSNSYQHTPGFYACGAGNEPDVLIAKEQGFVDRGNHSVFQGDTISYTLTVENFFDDQVSLLVSDAFDAYVDYLVGTLEIGKNGTLLGFVEDDVMSGSGLAYESDWLAYGDFLTFSFDVTVSAFAEAGSLIDNVASVLVFGPDSETPLFERESNLVQVRVEAVPEPATVIFFGTGLLGILALLRRRSGKG